MADEEKDEEDMEDDDEEPKIRKGREHSENGLTKHEKKEDEEEDEEEDDEEDSQSKKAISQRPREKRPIDFQFEQVIKQYNSDDDEEDEEDEDETHGQSLKESYQEVLASDSVEHKEKTYQPGIDQEEKHGKEGKKEKLENKKAHLKTLKKLEKSLMEEPDDLASVHTAIDNMFAVAVKERWDCESIISTYSNLENHPAIIVEPKKLKSKKIIKLHEKTGIPLGILPSKKDIVTLKKEKSEKEEEEEEEPVNFGEARSKEETKLDKKARKAAVKALRKQNRQRKKQLKKVFTTEKSQTQAQLLNQKQKNPSVLRF